MASQIDLVGGIQKHLHYTLLCYEAEKSLTAGTDVNVSNSCEAGGVDWQRRLRMRTCGICFLMVPRPEIVFASLFIKSRDIPM